MGSPIGWWLLDRLSILITERAEVDKGNPLAWSVVKKRRVLGTDARP